MRASIVRPVVLCAVLHSVALAAPSQDVARGGITTTIMGVVFDSLTSRGLAGASVQIADARGGLWARTVASDGSGRFEIADVPVGTYLLGFMHHKLDSLLISPPTLRVDVRTNQPMQVRLAIPSARTIARSMCGAKAVDDSTGVLIGYLRGADDSMPRTAGSLNVRWAEVVIEKGSIRRHTPTVDVASGESGSFALCGLPVGTPLLIQASSAADSSGSFEVTIPASGLLHRDAFVAPVVRTKVTVADSAPPVDVWRGTGRMRGQILAATGRPISGARVTVWGTGLETTTNIDGQFSLGALPGGTHTLEVRAVGFSPAQRAVDIMPGTAGDTEVELASLGITLDTIRVTAQRVYASGRLADFERRQKFRTGTGHLIDEETIEKRNPLELTDLLRTIPGVRVLPTSRGDAPFMRGGAAILGSGLCRPDIWVDGARVRNDEMFKFDAIVPIGEIRAVEVYPHAPMVPAELMSHSGCGSIVIWTGARRRD